MGERNQGGVKKKIRIEKVVSTISAILYPGAECDVLSETADHYIVPISKAGHGAITVPKSMATVVEKNRF